MVGPRKQDFWQKINILKGSHCILRIRGAPVCQKLGIILENKVVQKLKIEKKNTLDSGINVAPGITVAPPFKNFHIMILILFYINLGIAIIF
jgi:hypothetical protein